ncbi:MAG: TlpA family protein disulfide reductase [Roseiflexaceae bacterium]
MVFLKQPGLLLCIALVLAACGAGGSDTKTAPQAGGPHVIAAESRLLDSSGAAVMPNVGEIAPDFEYTLSDGTRHRLSDLRGKKVLLNFWATWCEPCRAEMPDLQHALDTYGNSVVVLGVNKLETVAVIPPFADELGVSFPLIVNTKGDISNRYGAKNIPTSFFINADGTIGFRQIGVMTYDFMKTRLDQLK